MKTFDIGKSCPFRNNVETFSNKCRMYCLWYQGTQDSKVICNHPKEKKENKKNGKN